MPAAPQGPIQPTKAAIVTCVINGWPFIDANGRTNFEVREFRVYEDICKSYLTGELVIETRYNLFEYFLKPKAPVTVKFVTYFTDGSYKTYEENFVVFSYHSRPRQKDLVSTMVITINLIGEEYIKDRSNTVTMSFAEIPGTEACRIIHDMYLATNGPLVITETSLGPIGTLLYPYEVINKSPITAIHDILDRCVFAAHPTCAPIYFRLHRRTAPPGGYSIGPLQLYLETAPITGHFIHKPGQGTTLSEAFEGYWNIIDFRPIVEKEEDPGGRRGGNKLASIKSKWDFKDGIIPTILNGAGFNWMGVMNNDHQPQPIDKFGPGGWAQTEADFLGVLRYKRKYRTLVPIQTGLDVTCGDRIKVRVPLANVDNPVWEEKILFVPRLTHQLKFTQGPERNPVTPIGTTDIYGVDWIG